MKIGDKVKCINNTGFSLYMNKSDIYTIRDIKPAAVITGSYYIYLVGVNIGFLNSRFILSTDNVDTLPCIKAASPVAVKEAPCSSCKRMNDVGVKTCWCCGGCP